MANDINKTIILGRLTRDPELKSTNGGTYFCRFSIANGYSKKQGDNYVDAVNFIDCIAWGKTAEAIAKYFAKGQRILLEGCLRWSQWENNEGKKQSKIEVLVEGFNFIEKKDSVQPDREPTGPGSMDSGAMTDDDIPF